MRVESSRENPENFIPWQTGINFSFFTKEKAEALLKELTERGDLIEGELYKVYLVNEDGPFMWGIRGKLLKYDYRGYRVPGEL